MAKYKIKSLTMTFGGTTYKTRKIPAGKQQSSEPVDVTTLDDTEFCYIPGALISHKPFDAVVQGITEQPTINTVGDVVLSITFNDGSATDTSKTVTIPNCILFDADAPDGDATGNRAADWTFHFRPAGGAAASNSGSGSNT
jgi:hypothetical protein